jgi:hypothetical protein
MMARNQMAAALELGARPDRGVRRSSPTSWWARICERVRPRSPGGHGKASLKLMNEEQQIEEWVEAGLRSTSWT